MADLVQLNLAIDSSTAVQGAADLDKLDAAGQRAGDSVDRMRTNWERHYQIMERQNAQFSQTSAAIRAQQDALAADAQAVDRILNRYDPFGAKLRQLQADFEALNKAAATGLVSPDRDSAIDTAYKKIQEDITKTKDLMAQAGPAGKQAFEQIAEGASKGITMTNRATTELLVMSHEVLQGRFSRIPGSFMVFAQSLGSGTAAMLTLGASAVAVAASIFVLTKAANDGHNEMVAMNNAIATTNDFAGVTRGSMRDLADQIAQSGAITVGVAKTIVTELVASGQLGAQSISGVARIASDFAHATGQDVEKIAPELAKLFSDPAKGAETLNQSMHFLTQTFIDHLEVLHKTGEDEQARLELLEKLRTQIPQYKDELTGLGSVMVTLKQKASEFWDALGGIGRKDTVDQQLQQAQRRLSVVAEAARLGLPLGSELPAAQTAVNTLQAQVDANKQIAADRGKQSDELVRQNALTKEINQSELGRLAAIADERAGIIKNLPADADDKTVALARDRMRQLRDEQEQAVASMTAKQRALSDTEIQAQLKKTQLRIDGYESDLDHELKIHAINQTEYDQAKLYWDLQKNSAEQLAVIQQRNQAGLTTQQRAALDAQLQGLKEQSALMSKQGANAADIAAQKEALTISEASIKAEAQVALIRTKSAEEHLTAQRTLREITQQDYDAQMLALKLQENQIQQNAVAAQLKLGIDEKTRAALQDQLKILQEQAKAIAQKGIDQSAVDADKFNRQAKERVDLINDETKALGLNNGQKQTLTLLTRMVKEGLGYESEEWFRLKTAIESAYAAQKAVQDQISMWNQAASVFSGFVDAVMKGGKNAFDYLRQQAKQFLSDLIGIFARRWILELGASAAGGAGTTVGSALLNSAAGQGAGTLAGGAANLLGGANGGIGGFSLAGSLFGNAANPALILSSGGSEGLATSGLLGSGGFSATIGSTISSLVGGGAELATAIAGAIPVIGWVVAIGSVLYSLFGHSGGGAKTGGYASSSFDINGLLSGAGVPAPGTDNGRYFTPNQDDASVRAATQGFGGDYINAFHQLGGTNASAFQFNLGYDSDPHGTAGSRVSAGLLDAKGHSLYSNIDQSTNDVSGAMALEYKRALLVALQNSDLPAAVLKVLKGLDATSAAAADIDKVISAASALGTFINTINTAIKGLKSFDPQTIDKALDANRSLYDVYQAMGPRLRDLVTNFDGTDASIQNLIDSTNQYRQAQLQLIVAYDAVGKSIHQMLGDTQRSIRMQGLNPQDTYNFLMNEAQTLKESMKHMTDPAQIQQTAQQINQDMLQAFGMLTPEQQNQMRGQFLTNVTSFGQFVDALLAKARDSVVGDNASNPNSPLAPVAALLQGFVDKLNKSADTNTAAATTQQNAATTQQNAATTNQQTAARGINVRVTVSQQGGAAVLVTDGGA